MQELKKIVELTQKYQTEQFWKDAISFPIQLEESASFHKEYNNHDTYPKCDMYNNGQFLMIEAEVPGITIEDINVAIEHNILIITGEFQTLYQERKYLLKERPSRKFEKKLKLPFPIDISFIRKEVVNGILIIKIPLRT